MTGGHGFLGSHLLPLLEEKGAQVIAPKSHEFDLRIEQDVKRAFQEIQPDILVHLAASVGGIGANRSNPGRFFYDNAMMGLLLLEGARIYDVEKVLSLGTICSYPKFTEVPFKEENFWQGYPEETNAPYGLAKKMLLVQNQAYRKQYDFPGIFLMSTNLYGPRDNFDLENSHVIPAMIRKIYEAKIRGEKQLTFWGSGKVSREFLYVSEAARALVLALENYSGGEPVNLGSGEEITIADLAKNIMKLMAFEAELIWDTQYPDGQPRRCLDVNQAKSLFSFENKVNFTDGLQKTIDWYLSIHK